MKTALRWIAGLMVGSALLALVMFLATQGDYRVAPLVTDDATLSSETLAGTRLHMRMVRGPEHAPTIIVLHGGPGGDFRSLQALDALADRYHVVFYDQRGAGLSERVAANRLTLSGYLEELEAVIEFGSPEQPSILIGHSWGAMLATAYLGRNPDAVRGAVLIEPGYLDADGRDAWEVEAKRYMSGPRYIRQAIATGFRAQHVSGPDAAAPEDYLVGQMVKAFTNHPDNPYHCGSGYTAPDWRFGALASRTWRNALPTEVDQLGTNAAKFEGPVLLLAGGCDAWLGPLQTQHLSRFENADLVTIPGAGHDPVWDAPEATLAVIRAFLEAD
ncbi:alpha/beta fold hydrolase [Jannaschia sp. 2305UL9-9]|uniref:alpha/beta fold hydrolase n=1 Tax=Jannaschia sp. 2305UL9-9 TaxID=3121638 RepID=UPI00352741AE